MRKRFPRWLAAVGLVGTLLVVGAGVALGTDGDDTPTLKPGAEPLELVGEEDEERLFQQDNAFITRRLAGDIPLDNQQAGALRAAAARKAAQLRKQGTPTPGPTTFPGVAWQGIGPNPIVQVLRSGGPFAAMSGRIGALAIRPSNGQIILGGAQGGIWLWDTATSTWLPKTGAASSSNVPSLAIGALAVAPTNDAIVYAGTGEGHLSGDSYFGNGVLKSTDGGNTWNHVSGDYFEGVAISRIAVDPTSATHLYAAVLRGRGGRERTTPTVHSKYGIWESNDGGVNWTLINEAKLESNGATDVEIDPQNKNILYASFWSDAIYKSTDGGAHWSPIMNFGFPSPNFAANLTRFSISISHPSPGGDGTLYAGFTWADAGGSHPSRVFKSTNGGATWSMLPAGSGADSVADYCGGQCFYDNVIEAAPDDPNIVFAGGQFNYGIGSGGLFRSDDGGTTWKNLGYAQHPDFQALAFEPDNTQNVVEGSDGGVWYSNDRGGRPNAADPLSAVTWQNLNGTVDPNTAGVLARTNLQISQFTSIATVPQFPPTSALSGRFWGGTQDNGTLRKSTGNVQWFDVAGGDGGQVLVDPTPDSASATCPAGFAPSCFIYGTFFGVSPYRFADGGAGFFSNQAITGGISTGDRSDFYIPFVMNKENPNQLFLGTYRLYRTDNARTPVAGDVHWDAISPDLTSGCAGPAPNGGRACVISAIGVGGGQAVYTGSIDGRVYMSTDAQVNDNPSWTREDLGELPNRPVTQFAVDRSNYRIAYAAYAGFNAATPSRPGHLFKTSDGGQNWTNVTGNLPDSPVNSVILDPSYVDTLYVGTDVGAFVTYNGGVNWSPLGTPNSMPIVTIWQLDFDSSHRVLAAGTHGRGAFRMIDTTTSPALVLSKIDAGVPVGPASQLEYTLTLRNEGNAAANNVVLTDPVPANTSFVSADSGGTNASGTVTWNLGSLAAGGTVSVHLTVSIANALKNKVQSIVNDGTKATATGGFFTTGSPFITSIASAYGVTLSPATQTGGAHTGSSASYHVTARNAGFTTDSYTMSSTGGTFAVSFFQSDCTTALTTVGPLAPGATSDVCVQVAVPSGAANGDTSTSTLTATSVADPSVSASATIKTIAVTVDTLLVDEDGNAPDVQSYYTTALTSAGVSFNTWDLATDSNIPVGYMAAFKNIVWFTGTTYPGPLLPYEARLKTFLDGGGRLFLSGMEVLDQAAGTTPFVHDYLHVTWDGTETQNDKATNNIHDVAGTLTAGLGTVPLNRPSGFCVCEDRVTPNGTAVGIFTDDSTAPDGLSFDGGGGSYKVVYLAFPFEGYGAAAQMAALAGRIFTFFGP